MVLDLVTGVGTFWVIDEYISPNVSERLVSVDKLIPISLVIFQHFLVYYFLNLTFKPKRDTKKYSDGQGSSKKYGY